ncbi:MAG: Uma2 family endonuclease [bacterium]|nr:Uma2 family endonuclease [bacterium]
MIEGAHGAAVVANPPEEEIDYPWGEPVPEGMQHWQQCADVALALRDWLRRQPGGDRAVVCHNTCIYYTEGDKGDVVAPDVAVAFGVHTTEEPMHVYKVWETGAMPAWVLEVASPSTVRGDVRDKPDLYAALGVAEYWRTDPTEDGLLHPPLQGDHLTGAHRRPIAVTADADGTLRGHSDALGLDLCWRDGELRLFDPATGTPLLTYDDQAQARTAAETRAARAEAELAALRRRLDPQR